MYHVSVIIASLFLRKWNQFKWSKALKPSILHKWKLKSNQTFPVGGDCHFPPNLQFSFFFSCFWDWKIWFQSLWWPLVFESLELFWGFSLLEMDLKKSCSFVFVLELFLNSKILTKLGPQRLLKTWNIPQKFFFHFNSRNLNWKTLTFLSDRINTL